MDSDGRAQFGRYLQSLRLTKKLSLRQVAGRMTAKVGPSYLSQIENGAKGPPSKDVLRSLADVFGVPVSEMFNRAGLDAPTGLEDYSPLDLDVALSMVLSDPRFQVGAKIQSDLTPATKLYIIRLYEKVRKVQLLPQSGEGDTEED